MKHTVIIVLMFVFGLAFHAGAVDQKDSKALFVDACSQCHSIDIPKRERLSKADWHDTVSRMRSNGLSISDKEAGIIIDYLAATYTVQR